MTEEHTTPEILEYEFIDEATKIEIANEHIKGLEREHFNWVMNKHRAQKMTLSGDERDEMIKQADEAISRNRNAIEIARAQRDELESMLVPAQTANANGNGSS